MRWAGVGCEEGAEGVWAEKGRDAGYVEDAGGGGFGIGFGFGGGYGVGGGGGGLGS